MRLRSISVYLFLLLMSISFSQTSPSEASLGFIYLNPLFLPDNKELARDFERFDFASIIEKFQARTDDESLFFVGLSWFHLLNYEKARSFLVRVKGQRYVQIASFLIDRIDAVIKKDQKAYEKWMKSIEKISNSMAKSERAFLKSWIEGKPALVELESAYRDAIKEFNAGKIDFVDIHAFNYVYFLKDRNLRQAHVELNKVVKYDFDLSQETLYYDAKEVKELSFPIVRLLSEVLYLRAVSLLESMFRMSLSNFLKLEDSVRNEQVLKLYVNDKGNYNTLIYFLENSLNVVILGVNNYYFIQNIREPSTFFSHSTYEMNENVRRILMYVKVN